jgi:hypothetical protein
MTRTLDGQSPSRVQSYLGGVSYPASKDQLLDVAKQNRAPVGVLEILRRLNEATGQFGGPKDVRRACVEHHQGPPTSATTRRAPTTSALPDRTLRRTPRQRATSDRTLRSGMPSGVGSRGRSPLTGQAVEKERP